MAKYEYKIENQKGIVNAQRILEEYSQDGWELHWQNRECDWWDFIFKRRIED